MKEKKKPRRLSDNYLRFLAFSPACRGAVLWIRWPGEGPPDWGCKLTRLIRELRD